MIEPWWFLRLRSLWACVFAEKFQSQPMRKIIRCFFLFGWIGLLSGQELGLDLGGYDSGDAISVSFSGGPGNGGDWIGVYAPGVEPGRSASLAWLYTNGGRTVGGQAKQGKVVFPAGTFEVGRYEVWFLANNAYERLAGPMELVVRESEVQPGWVLPRIRRIHGVAGVDYSGKVSAYAHSREHTFTKVAGPGWLAVSRNGCLSGQPGVADVGMNTFTLRVSHRGGHRDVPLLIEVFPKGGEVVRELKVMTYNAWGAWGQMKQGYRKGLESIILSGADVIGMQESTGQGTHLPERLAADLGWHYRAGASGSLGILSRYPITDGSLAAGIALGAKIRLAESPRREIILMNCHLDPGRYGPYAAQLDGANVASVMTEERASHRDEQIGAIMDGMSEMLARANEVPVFFTGDFNAPSHLDWTEEAAGEHDGIFGVPWPTSMRVTADGMIDSYREAHPDPVKKPGDTWSPVFRGEEPQDRIDLIYYKGAGVKTVSSEVFTTAVEVTLGRESSDTSKVQGNTWPSDHAAVVSLFRLTSPGGE